MNRAKRSNTKKKKNVYYCWWYEWGICTLVWSVRSLSLSRHLLFPCLYSLSYRCESRANHSPSSLQFVLSIIVNMCRTVLSSWSFRKSNWKRMNSRRCFRSSYLSFSSKTSTRGEGVMISVLVRLLTERFVIGIFHSTFDRFAFVSLLIFCICWLTSGRLIMYCSLMHVILVFDYECGERSIELIIEKEKIRSKSEWMSICHLCERSRMHTCLLVSLSLSLSLSRRWEKSKGMNERD